MIEIVFHATLKDLAKGFIKVAKKEVKEVANALVDEGRAAAVDLACAALEARTGLPSSVCRSAGGKVVDILTKDIRKKIGR